MIALAKDAGNDEDMAEMISYEIDSLSKQLSELEEKLKVRFYSFPCFGNWDCKLQYFLWLVFYRNFLRLSMVCHHS